MRSTQQPSPMAAHRYPPFAFGVDLPGRTWPGRRIEAAPRWCAVDLRDGERPLTGTSSSSASSGGAAAGVVA